MDQQEKIQRLEKTLQKLYFEKSKELLFHGWHHITFVRRKSLEFAKSINADLFLVESAALTHDLNYVVEKNSHPSKGEELRTEILKEAGYEIEEIKRIETIILEAHTGDRGESLSDEGKALSDGDTLFKALPTTPILFASKFISQNQVDIDRWADRIINDQVPLLEKNIYFYTDLAKERYLKWAKIGLEMVKMVKESLQDEDVREMLDIARKLDVI